MFSVLRHYQTSRKLYMADSWQVGRVGCIVVFQHLAPSSAPDSGFFGFVSLVFGLLRWNLQGLPDAKHSEDVREKFQAGNYHVPFDELQKLFGSA